MKSTYNRVACAYALHITSCGRSRSPCTVDPVSDLSRYLADAKGDRSIDDIAKQATDAGHPISRAAVAKYLRGEHGHRPPEKTLRGLAAGFRLDVRTLRELAGRPPGELGPYRPIDLAASLTQEQRDAIDELIKAFVSEGGQHEVRQTEAQKITKADAVTRAARRGRSRGKLIDKKYDDIGEESQDPGDMNPA